MSIYKEKISAGFLKELKEKISEAKQNNCLDKEIVRCAACDKIIKLKCVKNHLVTPRHLRATNIFLFDQLVKAQC